MHQERIHCFFFKKNFRNFRIKYIIARSADRKPRFPFENNVKENDRTRQIIMGLSHFL